VRFGALTQGSCRRAVDGIGPEILLQSGDCDLLTDGRPYRIGSDLSLAAVDMGNVLVRYQTILTIKLPQRQLCRA